MIPNFLAYRIAAPPVARGIQNCRRDVGVVLETAANFREPGNTTGPRRRFV